MNGSSARRSKRATTLWPAGFVKFTKTRPEAAASGGNASPSKPRSPPALIGAAQVEERRVADRAGGQDVDDAVLRHEQERRRLRRILDEGHRVGPAPRHQFEAQLRAGVSR